MLTFMIEINLEMAIYSMVYDLTIHNVAKFKQKMLIPRAGFLTSRKYEHTLLYSTLPNKHLSAHSCYLQSEHAVEPSNPLYTIHSNL